MATRKRLLTSNNQNLRRHRISTWSLPALAARLPDGKTVLTCPTAGVCASACFGRSGRYNLPTVRAAHVANLALVINSPDAWQQRMAEELSHPRHSDAYVRIHDIGDFFSDDYTLRWIEIMQVSPDTTFYAYTKEVTRFERLIRPAGLPNFHWVYSLGGREDAEALRSGHRYADVFPDIESLQRSEFHSNGDSDLLAVFGPSPVGMAANRTKFLARQGRRTFGEWQQQEDRKRDARRSAKRPDKARDQR